MNTQPKCLQCGKIIIRKKSQINYNIRHNINFFCDTKCHKIYINKQKKFSCTQCGIEVYRRASDVQASKTKRFYCSKSCAAKYNNTHKKYGYRRSKLEIWLEQQLMILYPQLKIEYNRVNHINSELDIFIPNLNLAFELNGPLHYEPIFGKEKLAYIQNNDKRKSQICLQKNIKLYSIDVSNFKYFKPSGAQKFLNTIIKIIDQTRGI